MFNDTKDINLKKARNKLGYIDPTVFGIDIGANIIHVSTLQNFLNFERIEAA